MFKKIVFAAIFCAISFGFSQEKNSLLWKISGNGLQKDSYLFGTMHVSEKIAFHLDDIFFEALQKAEAVALETDPTFWLENMFKSNEVNDKLNFLSYNSGVDFYNSPFKLQQTKKEQLMFFLSREDMLLNSLLYRTNQFAQNFQEDTFLDMFIYQSGKKFEKPIYSLEDYDRSRNLVEKAFVKSTKQKPDVWLQKLFKKDNFFTLMNNAYRDRNITFLDSINKGLYSKLYLKNMLYLRNTEMADNIDEIAKKKSLFAAIGAAHLPGEKGVIEKLRDKGYSVTPLTSKISEFAKKAKKEIENKFINTTYISQTSSDGFFTAKLPNKLYELNIGDNTTYLCPDLANGSYVIITRINTFSKLYPESFSKKDIDLMLVESIPGEILSKTVITKQGIKGLDIINKTKTGDIQRYQIFFTPLEMLIFKMHGKKNFVKQFGNQFFETIQFNNQSKEYTTVKPEYGGFSVKVPRNYVFTNSNNTGKRLLQATDEKDNYFFIREATLNDINYIEEDDFELKRIQERFYKNHEFSIEKSSHTKNLLDESYESHSEFNEKLGKYLYLKTQTNAGHYYLLGFLSSEKKRPEIFFNSFNITNFQYKDDDFEIRKDTSLYFSVKTTVKPKYRRTYFGDKKRKPYEGFTKETSYTSKANEQIFVELIKKHDLSSYKNIDSLWNDLSHSDYDLSNFITYQKKNLLNYKLTFFKTKTQKGVTKNKNDFYSYLLKDSLSSKAIQVKHILANNVLYKLSTLIDTSYKKSRFVTSFYDTFTPKDTLIGKPLFRSKTDEFFTALKNKDSLALSGVNFVEFEEKDINQIIRVLSKYNFADNQLKIKDDLTEDLSVFNKKKVNTFLENLYEDAFDNPNTQMTIIKSYANKRTKESYAKILNYLKVDVPLTSSKYDITSLFNKLNDSLSLAKTLYPRLLQFSTINEYKKPVYKLLAEIVEKDLIKPNVYESFTNQILTEAKIELKRQISKKIKAKTNSSSYSSSNTYNKNDLLNIYVKLLYPFRKDKNVVSFFKKLKYTDNYFVKTTFLVLQLKHENKLEKELFDELVGKLYSRGLLYKKLEEIDKTVIYPDKFKTKQEVYKSYLFDDYQNENAKDSIVFLGHRNYKLSKKEYEVYFYKFKPHKNLNSYNKNWKLNFISFLKTDKIGTENTDIGFNKPIDETKPIDEIIDRYLEELKLKRRKRVNLNENNYNYNNY